MSGLLPWSWYEVCVLRDRAASAGPLAGVLAAQAMVASCDEGLVLGPDALDELVRRHAGVRRVTIVERPRGPLGWFVVLDREIRYPVWLGRSTPLAASCGCHDFLAASLGACTHVLAVLANGWPRCERASPPPLAPALCWDPIRPISGRAPALERLWWNDDAGHSAPTLRRWFRGDDEAFVPGQLAPQLEALARWAQVPGRAAPAALAVITRERTALDAGCPGLELDHHHGELAVPLFPYQREGVARFLASGRLVLGDDMGLGKTAQAIAACHLLLATGAIERALIVVPAPLKAQWASEWRRFTGTGSQVSVVNGPPPRRRAQYRARRGALIINYELVRRDIAELQHFAPDLVVLDEAQRIKNRGTQTARVIKELAPARRLVLTGTPLENRLDELASVVEWVDDLAFEPRWRLDKLHAVRNDQEGRVTGAHRLDTIRERMAHCFLRRRRDDVLDQLPPRRDSVIPVPLTSRQGDAHDARAKPIAVLMSIAKHRKLTREERQQLLGLLTEQRIICNGLAQHDFEATWPSLEGAQPTPFVLDSLAAPKLGALRDLLDAILVVQRRKVVVFSQWRRMLQLAAWATRDILDAAGLAGTWFTGAESIDKRTRNIAAFERAPEVAVLWATDAGGVGLNLQYAASCVVNLDLPWNPAVLEQRIGRIHRLGQTKAIDVYNLVSLGGIEERIAGIIEDKRALFDGLLDSDASEVTFEYGARSQFERLAAGPQSELTLELVS